MDTECIVKKVDRVATLNEQNEKYLAENPLSVIVPAPAPPHISHAYREGVYAVQERLEKIAEQNINGFGEAQRAKDFPLRHSFSEGMYQRELFIPQGLFLVSHLHRDSYFSWIRQGELTMLTEEGGVRISAPMCMTSSLGCKRILFAHTDSFWITVHPNPTNSTDIEWLESQIHVLEGGYDALQDKIIDVGDVDEIGVDVDSFFGKYLSCIMQ